MIRTNDEFIKYCLLPKNNINQNIFKNITFEPSIETINNLIQYVRYSNYAYYFIKKYHDKLTKQFYYIIPNLKLFDIMYDKNLVNLDLVWQKTMIMDINYINRLSSLNPYILATPLHINLYNPTYLTFLFQNYKKKICQITIIKQIINNSLFNCFDIIEPFIDEHKMIIAIDNITIKNFNILEKLVDNWPKCTSMINIICTFKALNNDINILKNFAIIGTIYEKNVFNNLMEYCTLNNLEKQLIFLKKIEINIV